MKNFLCEYDFFNNWNHLVRIEEILSSDPQKKYPLCKGGGNLSISEAERKAAEFVRVGDEVSDQLKDKLPVFLKEYKELINFVTDQENAGEAIGIIREQVKKLQDEAAEIKKLNQLLVTIYLTHLPDTAYVIIQQSWLKVYEKPSTLREVDNHLTKEVWFSKQHYQNF